VTAIQHPDHALVQRILAGDSAEFRTLFDRFFPRLYRFALARLGGDHDAATEVVQLTFCKAIERLDSYRGEAALYTWFCQICRNAITDYCRARKRQQQAVLSIEDQPDIRAVLEALSAPAAEQPDMEAWRGDVLRLVQSTVDALPERYGEVLELKYVDGLSVRDIARRFGLGEKAAESLLTRARQAFREAIEEVTNAGDLLRPPQAG
jgi:RNA polymerase sigma-70 factor (ECF subfamily)